MHPLLKRQLARHFPGEVPRALESFIAAVNDAYKQSDTDRIMLERSLDISGDELLEVNAALRQQAVELSRSNAELERFAYIASHDLQEPLRTITAYLELLERRYSSKLDEDAREFITFATTAAGVMQQLIRDLLSFARITSRAQPFEQVDMAALVREVLAALGAAIEEARAQVAVGVLPEVLCDRSQMRQLVQNLLSNALKFRKPNQPARIEIAADRQGSMWRFAVTDNGIGVEAKYHTRIFEIFQRLHTSDEYPGTGIGLAMCRKIVERHGGEIGVESKEGAGATLWFTLPVEDES